jgi:hypothetical protein
VTRSPLRNRVGRLLFAAAATAAVGSVTVFPLVAYYATEAGAEVPAFFEKGRSLGWVTGPALVLAVLAAALGGWRGRSAQEEGPGEGPTPRLPRGTSWLVGAYLALGGFHAFATPLFEGPDEHSHFQAIQYLAGTGRVAPLEEEPITIVERIQPPLYYAALAPLARGARLAPVATLASANPRFVRRGGSDPANWLHGPDEAFPPSGDVLRIHLLRCAGLLFGAVAVVLACAVGAEVFPASPRLALACGAFVAFLPQFAHLGALFSNDAAAAAAGGAALLLALRLRRRPSRSLALGAGAAAGAATLAKLTGLLLVPVVLVAGFAAGRRRDRLALAGLVLVGFLGAAGWYFAANAFFYGDPFENFALHERLDPGEATGDFHPALKWGLLFPSVLFLSFFASFGSLTVVPAPGIAALFALLLLAAVFGLARGGGPRPRHVGLLVAAVLLLLGAQVLFNRRVFQPQGRHLLVVLPAIAPLLVAGLAALSRTRAERGPALAVGGLLLAHVASLFLDLLPSFRPPNAAGDPYRAMTDAGERLPRDPDPIAVEGPVDGAVVREPPRIRWETRRGEVYEVQVSVEAPRFARPNWDLRRPLLRFAAEGSFEFPPLEWEGLARGTAVYWRVVRRVPAALASRGEGTLRASEPRRVVRGD